MPSAGAKLRKAYVNLNYPFVVLRFEDGHEIRIAQGKVKTFDAYTGEVIVDYRPNAGIRVAPHFYTRDDEVESVVEIIDEILARGEWERYTHETATVT